jgi:hypothetical protein
MAIHMIYNSEILYYRVLEVEDKLQYKIYNIRIRDNSGEVKEAYLLLIYKNLL